MPLPFTTRIALACAVATVKPSVRTTKERKRASRIRMVPPSERTLVAAGGDSRQAITRNLAEFASSWCVARGLSNGRAELSHCVQVGAGYDVAHASLSSVAFRTWSHCATSARKHRRIIARCGRSRKASTRRSLRAASRGRRARVALRVERRLTSEPGVQVVARARVRSGREALRLTLRHTAISRIIAAGLDDYTVMAISRRLPRRGCWRGSTHPTEKGKLASSLSEFGGRREARTRDLCVANAALSQLS